MKTVSPGRVVATWKKKNGMKSSSFVSQNTLQMTEAWFPTESALVDDVL